MVKTVFVFLCACTAMLQAVFAQMPWGEFQQKLDPKQIKLLERLETSALWLESHGYSYTADITVSNMRAGDGEGYPPRLKTLDQPIVAEGVVNVVDRFPRFRIRSKISSVRNAEAYPAAQRRTGTTLDSLNDEKSVILRDSDGKVVQRLDNPGSFDSRAYHLPPLCYTQLLHMFLSPPKPRSGDPWWTTPADKVEYAFADLDNDHQPLLEPDASSFVVSRRVTSAKMQEKGGPDCDTLTWRVSTDDGRIIEAKWVLPGSTQTYHMLFDDWKTFTTNDPQTAQIFLPCAITKRVSANSEDGPIWAIEHTAKLQTASIQFGGSRIEAELLAPAAATNLPGVDVSPVKVSLDTDPRFGFGQPQMAALVERNRSSKLYLTGLIGAVVLVTGALLTFKWCRAAGRARISNAAR